MSTLEEKAGSTEDFLRRAWEWREIENPCRDCAGSGRKAYPTTACWAGGIGGNMITSGTCDRCWGTGDEGRPGINLRRLRNLLTEEQWASLRRQP